METNTQTQINPNNGGESIPPVSPNKNKKMLIILAIIIVIIIAAVLLKSKIINPTKTEAPLSPTEQLSKDIDSATTFDNESDLKTIDKEFN